jgi:Copper type II ascorbate-dependent monooxygenase, C-terminal domain
MFEDRSGGSSIRISSLAWCLSLAMAGSACGSESQDSADQSVGRADVDDEGPAKDSGAKAPRRDAGTKPAADAGTSSKDGGIGKGTAQLGVPCAVAKVLEAHCAECHGDPPNWGAPMSLVDHDDFQGKAPVTKSQDVAALVLARLSDKAKPMPPKKPLSAADKATLEDWIAAGAEPGTDDDSCVAKTPEPVVDLGGGKPLPPDAVCYPLMNHGKSAPNDKTKFRVGAGEQYAEFYFSAPWKEPSVMVSFRTIADQTRLLHHWLMYKTNGNQADGTIGSGIGTHIGGNVQLLAGWALGGSDIQLPDGIAATLPAPGGKIMLEWHYYNQTGVAQEDGSGVEVCVIPASKVDPKNVASLTWIGNENLGGSSLLGVAGVAGMAPNRETKVQDTCTPRFAGLPAGEPVRIFSFTPHMHKLGRHMRTWVARKSGTVEKLHDQEFQFDNQISYQKSPMIELWPGDKLVNECTFFNDTTAAVGFGPSSNQEMCYQFTYAYPANALVNGVSSLTGSTNTCWDNRPQDAARLIGMAP